MDFGARLLRQRALMVIESSRRTFGSVALEASGATNFGATCESERRLAFQTDIRVGRSSQRRRNVNGSDEKRFCNGATEA
jgi:hypothetical protein